MKRLYLATAAPRLLVWLAAVSLSGCAGIGSYSQSLIAARQVMNDTQAQVSVQLPCDVAVGALLRLPREQQAAIALLCAPADSKVRDLALESLLDEATR